MKSTINEIRSMLDTMNTRLEESEEQINDPEDKVIENNEAEQREKEELCKTKIDLGDTVTSSNIITFVL